MRGVRLYVVLLAVVAGISPMAAREIFAQSAPSSAPSPQAQPGATADASVQNLTAIVQQLANQVQKLSAQLDDVRDQEQEAREEARELRKELDDAKSKLASLAGAPADPPASHPAPAAQVAAAAPATSPASTLTLPGYGAQTQGAPAYGAPPQDDAPQGSQEQPSPQDSADQAERAEEDQQLTSAEIKEQSQTKVESGSKYRLRLSGIVLLNMFSNRGAVDDIEFPEIAEPPYPNGTNSTFGGSLRQSQISLEGFGPEIAGAHTSANIVFDFAGEIPETPDGAVTGIVRLRTGTIRFDWANTSIIAGQDTLFISPLSPTSFATLAVPPLSYSGNLWSWTPQIRIEHRFNFSDRSRILLQAGILDPLSGDVPFEQIERDPTFGEQSGMPAFAARIAWSHPVQDQSLTLGFGGYYSRQAYGSGRFVDAWATTVDLTVPLGSRLGWTSEFYRGMAVGGLGGGIGQSVLWNGSLDDPSTQVVGLDSLGGWTQIKFKVTPKLQLNAALGDDNPFSSELREYNGNTGYEGVLLARNLSPFFNVIYQPRSDTVLSIEYQRLKTYYLDSPLAGSNHVDLSMGYIF
jgi:outer membrane murein-binding lipoprotein Lpp